VAPKNTSDVGGEENVGNINTGDWMSYPAVMIPTTGTYTVSYRVAGWGGGMQFERTGGTPVYGTLVVPWTGGWQSWTTVSHTVNLSAGSLPIGIKATTGGWNINWFTITKARRGRAGERLTELDNGLAPCEPERWVLTHWHQGHDRWLEHQLVREQRNGRFRLCAL
jgi:hypothetical protein